MKSKSKFYSNGLCGCGYGGPLFPPHTRGKGPCWHNLKPTSGSFHEQYARVLDGVPVNHPTVTNAMYEAVEEHLTKCGWYLAEAGTKKALRDALEIGLAAQL